MFMLTMMTLSTLLAFARPAAANDGRPLDLAKFGTWMTWSGEKLDQATPVKSLSDAPAGVQAVGLQWDDPRDMREIVAEFAGEAPADVVVEY